MQKLENDYMRQQEQIEGQLEKLYELGFEKRAKNKRLLIKYYGDLEFVILKLIQDGERKDRRIQKYLHKQQDKVDRQIYDNEKRQMKENRRLQYPERLKVESEAQINEVLLMTKLLIIDCNNVMFAERNLMRKYNYGRVPKTDLMKKFFKKLIVWCSLQNNLKEIRFVWDSFDFDQYVQNANQNNKTYKNKQQEAIQNNFINSIQQANDQVSIVKWTQQINSQQIQIIVSSAKPNYVIADDLIFYYVQCLDSQIVKQTTIITSDRELTRRLSEQRADKFIGNGTYCRFIEELKLKIQLFIQKQ